MKIELIYQNSVITLPGAVLEKTAAASEQDLRVLLFLAASAAKGEDFDAAGLAVKLDMPERDVENALSFWRGAGLIKTVRQKKQKAAEEASSPGEDEKAQPVTMQSGVPAYTGKQIEEIMQKRKRLGQLLEECQKVLDRVFNVSESNMAIALSDVFHFDDEYILTLCSYCVGKKEGGVTMKYVYNTAYGLYQKDVLTVQQLEEYIAGEESRRDFENYMRHLFGIGGRKLTEKEKKFFESWRELGFPNEVCAYAYEIAVDNTGDAKMPYINKILTSWKKAGVRTLEGAKEESARHREEYAGWIPQKKTAGKGGKAEAFTSFDTGEFFRRAVENTMNGAGNGENKGEGR